MTNPLEQFFRSPKLYVKLPTQGKFYPENMVDLTANGEVAVYPMTAIDQIHIRTPDALLNGDAMVKVVGNCVPGVKNPKSLVEPDINTLMVAIRIASSGDKMPFDVKCPKCNSQHSYEVDLNTIIETQNYIQDDASIEIDGKLLIYLRPYNFEQRNLSLLNEIQESQAVSLIQNDTSMDTTTKYTSLGKHVATMAERTYEILAQSITKIIILQTGEQVDNKQFIIEFIKNISKLQADILTNKIKQLNGTGIDPNINLKCESCNHEWLQPLEFDPASFFA